MEEGDGEGGPGKLSSGTGLGEGEGQKDVSEKIENQVRTFKSFQCQNKMFTLTAMRHVAMFRSVISSELN